MLKKKQNYTDIPFFISKNAFTGDFNIISNLPSIRQSIKNIVLTNNGERSFDYEFGCNIYDKLFDNISDDDIIELRIRIASKLQNYEPRISLNDIYINNYPQENRIDIIIDYNIPTLGIFDVVSLAITRTR